MRYKGMLWIDGEPNRLLFLVGFSGYTAPTGIGRGAMNGRTVLWCLLGYSFRKMRFAPLLKACAGSHAAHPPLQEGEYAHENVKLYFYM